MFFRRPKGANSTRSQKGPFEERLTRVRISKAESLCFLTVQDGLLCAQGN